MELISKKDLLAVTGISYGQLYRWKRQKLIPEEWFLKKSAFTGQETFFPKEQMITRIQSILALKEKHSLEEVAKRLSPDQQTGSISGIQLGKMQEIGAGLANMVERILGRAEYSAWEAAYAYGAIQALRRAELAKDRLAKLIARGMEVMALQKRNMACTIFLAGKKYKTLFSDGTVVLDGSMKVVAEFSVGEALAQMKAKYQEFFVEQ
jgi:hypothetical protein